MCPRLPRRQRSAVKAIGEIRDAARLGKKDCGLPHASHATGRIPGVIRAKKERPLASLRKPQPRLQSTSAAGSLAGTTRTPRLDQRAAVFFLPFGAAAAFGAGHGAW